MRLLKPVRGRQHEMIDFDLSEGVDANFEQGNLVLAEIVKMVMSGFDQAGEIDSKSQLDP